MSEIKLSPEMETALGKVEGELRLVDADGKVKGFVISPYMHSLLSEVVGREPSREVINSVLADSPGYTTQEALAKLRKRFPGFDGEQ